MIASVPARAPAGPPLIGASTTVTPGGCAGLANLGKKRPTNRARVDKGLEAFARQQSVRASHCLPKYLERRQRDDNRVASIGQLPWRCGAPGLTLQERPHRFLAHVADPKLMPAVEEFAGHGQPHVTDAEISNSHGFPHVRVWQVPACDKSR
jgi:hypothetical protein